MKKRMLAVIIAINLMLATAAVKGYVIAVGGAEQTASSQSSLTITVANPRGTVYDCEMRPLTNTATKTVAVLTPTVKTVTAVTEQLGDKAKDILERLKSGKPVLAEVPMDFECDSAVIFQVSYGQPTDQLAPHVIGYLNGEGDGVTGIQKAYNALLKPAEPLKVTYTVDATGRPLSGIPARVTGETEHSGGVVLTLDSKIQRIVEAQSQQLKKGAIIVMESSTGKLKGVASFPDYSPDKVAQSLESADAPLLNRALSAYNVGSIFKLCVAASALREGIDPSTAYNCDGYLKIGTDRFNCNKLSGHGTLNMPQSLSRSCNCYYIELGRSVGATPLYDTCIRFGFNRTYSLAEGISTATGLLPSRSTLLQQPSALANLSFGQGDLMLTPLHIAVMIATIDNGGKLVTPTLIEGTTESGEYTPSQPPTPRRALDEGVCTELRRMMQGVITDGTGTAARPDIGVAGGKTATAETGWMVNGKTVTQSWFAGYWQGYTVVVLCEDGVSGSSDCAPVFKRICDMMSEL